MSKANDNDEGADGKGDEAQETSLSSADSPNNSGVHRTGRDLGVWERSLEDQSNWLGIWTLSFLSPLMKVGAHKVLDADDMGLPSHEDRSDVAYEATLKEWKAQCAHIAEVNAKLKARYEAKLSKCRTEEQRNKVKPPTYKEPRIGPVIMKAFGRWQILLGMVYYVVGAFLAFIPVMVLYDLVAYFEAYDRGDDDYEPIAHPWFQVAILTAAPVFVALLQTRHSTIMAHCSTFARTAISTMLYRKALTVSAAGRAVTNTGEVVNMMSNDTAQIQRFLQFLGMTLVAPLQIILSLYLIYQQVGHCVWVGVGFMVLLSPVNTWVFSVVSKQRRLVLKNSDARVKMMNEILNGIRIIKFYAWERPFRNEVEKIRGLEMDALTKLAYTSAVGFSCILLAAPLIQPILVFVTYVAIQDEPLSAATAFTTVALFNMMRFPFAFLPMGFLQLIQARISLRRIERYLDLPELAEYVDKSSDSSDSGGLGSIVVKNGSFSWAVPGAAPIRPIQDPRPEKKKKKRHVDKSKELDEDDASAHSSGSFSSRASLRASKVSPITLQNLTFTIEPGSLVGVVGTVGSGKSSLLSAILGEMEPINDSKVYLPRPDDAGNGFVSYCTQTPWIVNDTLRGNILFGRPYDEERYEKVIEACALVEDLLVLPAADFTEIGERGINLSGGQKARVALARAMYSADSKVILMDDPLSAVDAHVGEHIFSNAIAGNLSEGLTRVLVTHHVHLLPRCDSVIVMNQGQIQHHGRFDDLIAQGVNFTGAIDVSKAEGAKEEESGAKENENDENAEQTKNNGGGDAEPTKDGEENPDPKDGGSDSKKRSVINSKTAALRKSGKKLVKEEERGVGEVDGSAYFHYAEAGGICIVLITLIVQGIGRGFEIYSSFWLIEWAQSYANGEDRTNFYVGIYGLLGLLAVLSLVVRSIVIAIHRLYASIKIHNDLTESILRAPVSFFDITPTGRVLNRFAADMDKIDLELTQSLSQGLSTIFSVAGSLAAISVATKWTFLVPLIPASYLYYVIQKWFRKTSTELQRINSVANSPIFADFSQVLSGTSSVRAFDEETRFFRQCRQSFDIQNASYMLVQLTNYWLGLRLDLMGALLCGFIGAVAVATLGGEFLFVSISAGSLGLALMYSIEMTNFAKHGVRMMATIEAQMSSVERVLFYTNNIEPEAPEYMDEDPASGKWPSKGAIELQNASLRYRDGPLVLKGLSIKIMPGEKVGVCGRTGSGKSSLMVSLFRISEIEEDGAILIDGVNTKSIGTVSLRSNLSIIPQDPIVFSNTVRYNLDPFYKHTNEELWDVLRKVNMEEAIDSLPGGLLEQVAEGGENFSQGQRQLLCIARALLRKPKILVLDEATASIDNATDNAIQEMIRKNFADATVLTIAHRLNTIMDSDRVLVLDDGRMAEFDCVDRLLEKENGMFRAMVEKSRRAKEAKQDD